jgi:hypothetical protein
MGSQLYNYKMKFITVLIAAVDRSYCFVFTDVVRASDVRAFVKSSFESAYEQGILKVSEHLLFVADDAAWSSIVSCSYAMVASVHSTILAFICHVNIF